MASVAEHISDFGCAVDSETRHVTIKDKNYVLIEKDDIVDETFDGLVQCLYDCGIIDNMEEYKNE